MVRFKAYTSLVPLVRYANSKIRAQRSISDYLTWARRGEDPRQARIDGGLPENTARPSRGEPRLLTTWERKAPWRREACARYFPGYKWAVHGVLNPRYGRRMPATVVNASGGLQDATGDQDRQAAIHREQRSIKDRIVPVTPNPFVSGNSCQPGSLLVSDVPKFRDTPAITASAVRFSETDSLYANPSASVAPSTHSDGKFHAITETIRPYDRQQLEATDSLRTSMLMESQDRSDTPSRTEAKANEDILASLNRGMDETLRRPEASHYNLYGMGLLIRHYMRVQQEKQ